MLDRHVTRLENMANDLLDLNAVERPADQLRLEDISLPSLAEWTKNLFTSRAKEKNLSFLVETLSPQAFFRSDRKLVELMLRNLLDNAIKFTPAGSVECRLEQTDEDIVICVSDTGVGIRKEDQPRVFERFFQADSSRSGDSRIRGTGLGLAIVRHAAEQLNARIELQSELGRGTTITISIPTVNPV
jgi:two-component system phosphate regulon sensor histidine kinase PhoR